MDTTHGTVNTLPDYGNWVPAKFIYAPAVLSLILLALALVFPLSLLLAAACFLVCLYFGYARYRFSSHGGNVQGQVYDLVIAHLDWDGNGAALDIGCGNGPLAVKLAQRYPAAHVVGVDYWGAAWEYSQRLCERNAQLEGVAGRVRFQKASASALPFANAQFDVAVSNLTFHEVKDAEDKRELIREALRVVRPGGTFVLQDLFLIKPVYGEIDDLLSTIRGWGVQEVAFIETRNATFIPWALKLPFMVGTMGIIVGKK